MLNWLTRYAPALAALESRGPLGSVLDVGAGPYGLACVRPEQRFVGVDIDYPSEPVATMVALQTDPGPMPFEDGAFDTVLCLDALEHIPRPDRAGFVVELARVAARRVLIACPTDAGQPLDDFLRATYRSRGEELPAWLAEHGLHVLPSAGEVEAFMRSVAGFEATEIPMGNIHLQTMLVLGDLMGEFVGSSQREVRDNAAAWTELLAGASFGPSLRAGWVLERRTPRVALVTEADLEGSALEAVRAPGAILRSGPRAGAEVGRETVQGVEAETSVDERLVLWLSPDWAVTESWAPALATYIVGAPSDGSTCLCLDASAAPGGVDDVARSVVSFCEQLGGDGPYGDVVLLTEAADRGDAVEVGTVADVRAALTA